MDAIEWLKIGMTLIVASQLLLLFGLQIPSVYQIVLLRRDLDQLTVDLERHATSEPDEPPATIPFPGPASHGPVRSYD